MVYFGKVQSHQSSRDPWVGHVLYQDQYCMSDTFDLLGSGCCRLAAFPEAHLQPWGEPTGLIRAQLVHGVTTHSRCQHVCASEPRCDAYEVNRHAQPPACWLFDAGRRGMAARCDASALMKCFIRKRARNASLVRGVSHHQCTRASLFRPAADDLDERLQRRADPAETTEGLRIDSFVSFSSRANGSRLAARAFYRTWLSFWPFGSWQSGPRAQHGRLLLIVEKEAAVAVRKLARCLDTTPCGPYPLWRHPSVRPFWRFEHTEYQQHLSSTTHRWGGVGSYWDAGSHRGSATVRALQMNLPKFEADRAAAGSDIIAFIDDDSCALDHILPSEVVDRHGRLVARGVQLGDSHTSGAAHRRDSARTFGIFSTYSDINFMINFPVYIWTAMLHDFRVHVVAHVLPARAREAQGRGHDPNASIAPFWAAVGRIMADNANWFPSEYCNLMSFAASSPKWRRRYRFEIVPSTNLPVLNQMAHHSGWRSLSHPTCAAPASLLRERDSRAFISAASTRLLYCAPGIDDGCISDIGKPDHEQGRCIGSKRYAQFPYSSSWLKYMVWRQEALTQRANRTLLSARDACGSAIVSHWERCFASVRPELAEASPNV